MSNANSSLGVVVFGLAIGIALIVTFSFIFPNPGPREPLMTLTTSDGKTYKGIFNNYCTLPCDFEEYARVFPPGPAAHLDRVSGFVLKIENSIEQPRTVKFYLPNFEAGQYLVYEPAKREAGRYFLPVNITSGEQILDVVAVWDNNVQNPNKGSVHRFKVVIDSP